MCCTVFVYACACLHIYAHYCTTSATHTTTNAQELDQTTSSNTSTTTNVDEDDADIQERQRAVASLLHAAFTGRASQQVDILTMAAAVARGQTLDTPQGAW